jgi:hypothetical protein
MPRSNRADIFQIHTPDVATSFSLVWTVGLGGLRPNVVEDLARTVRSMGQRTKIQLRRVHQSENGGIGIPNTKLYQRFDEKIYEHLRAQDLDPDNFIPTEVTNIEKGGPLTTPDPIVGDSQMNRYYVDVEDMNGNWVGQYSVNYDPSRDIFGVIKQSSGK